MGRTRETGIGIGAQHPESTLAPHNTYLDAFFSQANRGRYSLADLNPYRADKVTLTSGAVAMPASYIERAIRLGLFSRSGHFSTQFQSILKGNFEAGLGLKRDGLPFSEQIVSHYTPFLSACVQIVEELVNQSAPDSDLHRNLSQAVAWIDAPNNVNFKIGPTSRSRPNPNEDMIDSYFPQISALKDTIKIMTAVAPNKDVDRTSGIAESTRVLNTMLDLRMDYSEGLNTTDAQLNAMLSKEIHKGNSYVMYAETDLVHDSSEAEKIASRAMIGGYALLVRSTASDSSWPRYESRIEIMGDGRRVLFCRAIKENEVDDQTSQNNWQTRIDKYKTEYKPRNKPLQIAPAPTQAPSTQDSPTPIETTSSKKISLDRAILGSLTTFGDGRYLVQQTPELVNMGISGLSVSWDAINGGYDVIGQFGDSQFSVFLGKEDSQIFPIVQLPKVGMTSLSEAQIAQLAKYCVHKVQSLIEDAYRVGERGKSEQNPLTRILSRRPHLRLLPIGHQMDTRAYKKQESHPEVGELGMSALDFNTLLQRSISDFEVYSSLPPHLKSKVDAILLRAVDKNLDPYWRDVQVSDSSRKNMVVLGNPGTEGYSPTDPKHILSVTYVRRVESGNPPQEARNIPVLIDTKDLHSYLDSAQQAASTTIDGRVYP